jgi:hypothetical protein
MTQPVEGLPLHHTTDSSFAVQELTAGLPRITRACKLGLTHVVLRTHQSTCRPGGYAMHCVRLGRHRMAHRQAETGAMTIC